MPMVLGMRKLQKQSKWKLLNIYMYIYIYIFFFFHGFQKSELKLDKTPKLS